MNLIFIPKVEEIYPIGYSTTINVGKIGEVLEGEFRPQFFSGIATIVIKLLLQIFPDLAVFGEKDYQQLCVIKKVVADLNLPISIHGVSTIREADGLAVSSRNKYLSDQERQCAPELYKSMNLFVEDVIAGLDVPIAIEKWSTILTDNGFNKIEYLVLCDPRTLELKTNISNENRVLVAAWLGKTRLIDNIFF